MNFSSLVRWPLAVVIVFGAQAAAAQSPLSEGAERQPSRYAYPLRTWSQPEPSRALGKIRDQTSVQASLMHKLQSIVIPRIEFHDITVATAVDVLRRKSRELDPDPNPETRGVNIFVRSPEPSSESSTGARPAPANTNVRLTLTLERLPLLEALKYMAAQTGMKVAVEPYAISLVSQGEVIPNLVSASYGVPPELLGRGADPCDFSPCVNLNAWFEAKGVGFPAGASAVYLTSTRLLIVRNTPENLDKIVSVISSALKPTTAPPANP